MNILKLGITFVLLVVLFVILFLVLVMSTLKIMKSVLKFDKQKWDNLFNKFSGKGLLVLVLSLYYVSVLIMVPISMYFFGRIDNDMSAIMSLILVILISFYGSFKLPKSKMLIEKRMK